MCLDNVLREYFNEEEQTVFSVKERYTDDKVYLNIYRRTGLPVKLNVHTRAVIEDINIGTYPHMQYKSGFHVFCSLKDLTVFAHRMDLDYDNMYVLKGIIPKGVFVTEGTLYDMKCLVSSEIIFTKELFSINNIDKINQYIMQHESHEE